MYRMNSGSLTRGKWFQPESQPFVLQERDSSCTIQLGPDDPEIAFTDWILDDSWPEGNYVWRVKSIDDQDNTETRTIGLEHVIKILDDRKLPNEVTTKTLAGNNSATTVTAKKAVRYLLSLQGVWELGDFEYNVSNPYEFSAGESIYDAIQTITETLEDAVWEYSLDVFPFKLHIRQRDNSVACEMRGGRNLNTMKRSVTRSGMYTRIYPIGKNNLHIDGDYLQKNEGLYGRIDKVETDQSKTTKANLQAWAQARLNRHCEPTMTISIGGLELSAETGEDLDRLKLNKICLCPLPKSGIQISERIVKLQWRDRRKEPENVTVNLCNSSADVASIIKESSRSGGKAAAGQAKQNYLFEANGEHLYYEVFDDCGHLHSVLEMTSESLRIAFDNEIASTRSEFQMTSESLRIKFENDLSSTRSEFQMTSESLRIAFQNADASLRSSIQAEAGRIGLLVEGYGNNATVKRASIVLAINNGTSSAHIDADEVYIGNQKSTTVINGKCSLSDVTADYIQAKIASLASLNVASLTSARGGISVYSVGTTTFTQGGVDCYVPHAITSLQIVQSGNTYTLQRKRFSEDSWANVGSFSRATTLTGVWSGGGYTVTASPQGNTIGTIIGKKGESWSGNTCQITVGYENPASGAMISTGCVFNVDASGRDAASGVASGRHGSSYSWDFIITRGDGTTKTLVIDCSDIYTAARSGYTLGIFTQQTITLQGSQTSALTLQGEADSVYKEMSSGGTDYYQADSDVTVYPGDGGSFTVQGTAYGDITPIGSPVWFKQHSSSETPSGTWYTYHTSDPGGTTYKRFAAGAVIKNLRNPGTTTKNARGTGYTITPIKSNTKKHLVATTRYKAGTNIGKLYNAGTISTDYYTKS